MSGGSEDEDECASSPAGSNYDDGNDIIKNAMSDEVTKQLAAAGPYLISILFLTSRQHLVLLVHIKLCASNWAFWIFMLFI